jgi:PII-like signaling protein
VNEDCLKLTTYFGERDRAGDGFLADALSEIYGRHGLATSLVLRGVEGFGAKHHLHTDRLLSLSEDLPLVSVAVDTRPRIEAALDEVSALRFAGLVTLERARMLTDGVHAVRLPEDLHEATKLTVYVGRGERIGGRPAHQAVVEALHRRGVDGATVLLGVDGTVRGERRRARFAAANADVPLMIVSVGDGERIAAALPELDALLDGPLATVERVTLGEPPLPARQHDTQRWLRKLTVYSSEQAKREGRPLHVELVRALRGAGAAGATCLRGIWGYHGDHPPHGDRLLALRRHVPVMTVAIDEPEPAARWLELVSGLVGPNGLVTSELVPVARAAKGNPVPTIE